MTLEKYARPGASINNTQIRVLPTKRLTAHDAINAVVAAEGDLELAAERLFGYTTEDGSEVSAYSNKTKLIALLAEDASAQQDLQRILRTLSLLRAFASFNLVSTTIDGTLEHLDANNRARLMTRLLDSIAVLTDDHTQNINTKQTNLNMNMTEALMKKLPPDIQQAVKVLAAGELDENSNSTLDAEWSLGDPPPNAAT